MASNALSYESISPKERKVWIKIPDACKTKDMYDMGYFLAPIQIYFILHGFCCLSSEKTVSYRDNMFLLRDSPE